VNAGILVLFTASCLLGSQRREYELIFYVKSQVCLLRKNLPRSGDIN
jgi:hypothetical protein